MRRNTAPIRRLALLLLLALPAVAAAAPPAFDAEAEHVLLVSFDGLRPDLIEKADMRNLQMLRRAGRYTNAARAVLPSITLVNHASMVSGVGPEKHGIDWNYYKFWKGALEVPTVFDLAKKAGLRTALVAGKRKFVHLDREGTIDRFHLEDGSPRQVAEQAIEVLGEHRPNLLMIHFRHPDSEGHENGWLSEAQLRAARDADRALGEVLNALDRLGLTRKTAVIVTADHGGEGHGHGGGDDVSVTIPWIAAGAEVPGRGPVGHQVTTYDTAATIADLLGLDVPASWDGRSALRPTEQTTAR